jgi:hypothetical protein
MFSFLDQMAIHAQIRRLREKGLLIDDSASEQYTRALLLTSPPFAGGSPGTVRDVRNGREVPCPLREALVNTLAEFLVLHGFLYAALVDAPWLALRRDVRQATRTIRQVLEKFYPEHRHKKLWLAYEEVVTKIDEIPPDEYRRLRTDLRKQRFQWRRELAHCCFLVFRGYLPVRETYVDDAIDHALAAIFIHLEIESGERIFVAGSIRKDRAAVRNAELRENYFAPSRSTTDSSEGNLENT